MTEFDHNAEQISERVYRRQIDLLYNNQTLAVFSTAAAVFMLMFFLNLSVPWTVLLPWAGLFALVLATRLLATWLYQHKKRNHHPLDNRLAEKLYFVGVTLTGASWGSMTLYLFPMLDPDSQILLLLTVQGFVSVSHNTMGYRRLPYLFYILLLALPAVYVVYRADFAYPVAIMLLLVIHLVFVLRTANAFYNGYTAMLYLQEESISREHKLLLQREQASLANQAKSEFLSRMSHELRTPLNAVLGMNELQMLDKHEPLTRQQRERAEKINEAGKHLLSLVNDVLDLSRIEAGSLTVKLEPIDLQQSVRDACKLVENRAAEQKVTIGFEALPEPVWVRADAQRLKQVIVNLLDNAVKYNRMGGSVTVSLSPGEGDSWRLSVVDTGYGIARQDMSELFKPFARLDQNRSSIDGAGIGLSFSKQLVEIMHGKIGVDSRVGEGSCFWVEMPAAEPVVQPSRPVTPLRATADGARQAAKPATSGNRLLLVEDNLVNQEVAMEMLQGYGFSVDVACNGEEALQRFKDNTYSLILMDCEMPVMDGLTATRRLRQMEQERGLPPTPVIALTAHAIHGAREKCLACGMDDFLSKPFSNSELRNILANWIALPEPAAPESTASAETADNGNEADSGEILDMSALNRLHTRKASLVNRVVQLYIEQSPDVLDSIDNAFAAGDYETLSNIAHTFKSSSLTVGAVRVADMCRQIEAGCQQGEVDADWCKQIRQDYLAAEKALLSLLQADSVPA